MEKQLLSGEVSIWRGLVVDAQEDFCDGRGSFGASELGLIHRAYQNGIIPLLKRARKNGVLVGWTQAIYKPGEFPDFPLLAVKGDRSMVDPDTGEKDPDWRVRIYRGANRLEEAVFQKDTHDSYTWQGCENGLEAWLGTATYVIVCGFTTTHCVGKAVEETKRRGRVPVIPVDCVGVRAERGQKQEEILAGWRSDDSGVIVVPSQERLQFLPAK